MVRDSYSGRGDKIMSISTRYEHQANIPLWMVKDLNRSNLGGLTKAHKRVYWEDVAQYPEVMMRLSDYSSCHGSHYPGWIEMKMRWKGCLRVLPFADHKRYDPCRWPIYQDNFCWRHLPKAIIDGKAPTDARPPSAWERFINTILRR
jgi:hypothetical protein